MKFVIVIVNDKGLPIGVYGNLDGDLIRFENLEAAKARLRRRFPEAKNVYPMAVLSLAF